MAEVINDDQIYQEYFRRLNDEFEESVSFMDTVCDSISGAIHSKFIIKDNCPVNYKFFSDKYVFTACSQLRGNEKLFIKSAVETYKLCEKFDNYIESKLS